jgi:hypothetical protein
LVVLPLAACGGIFRDFMANFLGCFMQQIEQTFVLHTKLMAMIIDMELAHSKGWHNLWIESDSKLPFVRSITRLLCREPLEQLSL